MASEEDLKYAGSLAILAKLPEFAILKRIINGQIEARRKQLDKSLVTQEDIMEHNKLVAEISGMATVICYPDMIAKKLELEKEIKKEMEKANDGAE